MRLVFPNKRFFISHGVAACVGALLYEALLRPTTARSARNSSDGIELRFSAQQVRNSAPEDMSTQLVAVIAGEALGSPCRMSAQPWRLQKHVDGVALFGPLRAAREVGEWGPLLAQGQVKLRPALTSQDLKPCAVQGRLRYTNR